MSGIDTALFVLLAADVAREQFTKRRWAALAGIGGLLLGLLGKTVYETLCAATIFVDSSAAGFVAVPLAHWVGGLVGGMAALLAITRTVGTRPC